MTPESAKVEVDRLSGMLQPGERVVYWVLGHRGRLSKKWLILAVTNRELYCWTDQAGMWGVQRLDGDTSLRVRGEKLLVQGKGRVSLLFPIQGVVEVAIRLDYGSANRLLRLLSEPGAAQREYERLYPRGRAS